MKNKLKILVVTAFVISACGPTTHVSSGYVDDIYYSPGDTPPPVIEKRAPERQTGNNQIVISEERRNQQGTKTQENYVFTENNQGNTQVSEYNLERARLANSDTTALYNNDTITTVINNYYTDDNDYVDYSWRINRFHHGFYFDYSPYWGYGFNSWYGPSYGYYGGFYDPWFYDPWYYGAYSGWYGWGFPLYGALGFGGYWGGYGGGWGHHMYSEPYYTNYGKRRTENSMIYGGGRHGNSGTNSIAGQPGQVNLRSRNSGVVNNTTGLRNATLSSQGNANVPSNYRSRNEIPQSAGQQVQTRSANVNTGVAIERRRANYTTGSATQVNSENTTNVQNQMRSYNPGRVRQATQTEVSATSGRNYAPSYSTPRSNYRPSYNREAYSTNYSRPRIVQGTTSAPRQRSTSTYSNSVRSSTSNFNRGSSSSGSNVRYAPSSGGTRSTNYTPSYNSGGSRSSGGGGSNSSGSGYGHRR
ncbi:MAG: hypothetical protein Q8862_02155 [Bacteroidota bacterium]|nr:hypothetical protein [Bacteroidota bacterium]